jgi:hypothetical protein
MQFAHLPPWGLLFKPFVNVRNAGVALFDVVVRRSMFDIECAWRTGRSRASPPVIRELALGAYHCSPQLLEVLIHLPVAWHAPS